MVDQLGNFKQRLSRINAVGNDSYYDPELKMNIPKRVSQKSIKRVKVKPARKSSLLISIILGGLALMLSYLLGGRFALFDLNDPILVYGAAAALVLILGSFFHLKSLPHMGAQFTGLGAMVVSMHNLVWMFPTEFAMIYSAEFVSMVQDTTTARSLSVLGTTIMF